MVRASGHMQMSVGCQFARLVSYSMWSAFTDAVAIRNDHITIQHVAAAQLRLRVRFDRDGRGIVHRREHLGHRITRRPRRVGQVRVWSCLSRYLLRQQMWMTCCKHRDSYQEVNSLQGASGESSSEAARIGPSASTRCICCDRTAAPATADGAAKDRATQFVRFEACQTHHPLRLNDFTEASLDLSTMSSAQRDLLPLDEAPAETEAAAPFALKEQVAERLAAHRARRNQHLGELRTPIAKPPQQTPAPPASPLLLRSAMQTPRATAPSSPRRLKLPFARPKRPPRSRRLTRRPSPTPSTSSSPNSINGGSRPQRAGSESPHPDASHRSRFPKLSSPAMRSPRTPVSPSGSMTQTSSLQP